MKYEIHEQGEFTMIHIIGNIDGTEASGILEGEIARQIAKGRHHFVFNLRRTTFLDSGGISVFIHCLCDAQEHQGFRADHRRVQSGAARARSGRGQQVDSDVLL